MAPLMCLIAQEGQKHHYLLEKVYERIESSPR